MCIRDRERRERRVERAARPEQHRGHRPARAIVSLIHISEPTRLLSISYAVFCLKKKHKRPISTRVRSSAASDGYKRQGATRASRRASRPARAAPRPPPGESHRVSYTHLRAHETPEHLVCRLLLEKKTQTSDLYTRKIVGSVRWV